MENQSGKIEKEKKFNLFDRITSGIAVVAVTVSCIPLISFFSFNDVALSSLLFSLVILPLGCWLLYQNFKKYKIAKRFNNLKKKKTLDDILKISIIAGILIIALAVVYYLVIYIPKRDEERLELQKNEQLASEQSANEQRKLEQLKTLEGIKTQEPVVSNEQEETVTNITQDSTVLKEDIKKIETSNDDYEKQQKKDYEAQLSRDKEAYNDAIEKLKLDYNHAVDALKAKERAEGGYDTGITDCSKASGDEQTCQKINRIHAKYQIEYDYLEATYKANLKSIDKLKYW